MIKPAAARTALVKPAITQALDEALGMQELVGELPVQQRGELSTLGRSLRKELQPMALECAIFEQHTFTLPALVNELLPRLEGIRKNALTVGGQPDYSTLINNFLKVAEGHYRKEVQEGPGTERYWEELSGVLREDFTAGYKRIAERRNTRESSFGYRYVYGNRASLTVLPAMLGLATLRMPYSTPLVMGGLGTLGHLIAYPAVQGYLNRDLSRLARFTAHHQKRITESVLGSRTERKYFELPSVLLDLVPLLETARLAGQGLPVYQQRVELYLAELHRDFDNFTGSDRLTGRQEAGEREGNRQEDEMAGGKITGGHAKEKAWAALETAVNEEFLPRFAGYAAAQSRIEQGGFLRRLLSHKWASAALTAAAVSPLYFMTTRMLPLGNIDDALMVVLAGVGGYNLPKIINPGAERLEDIYNGLCKKSEAMNKTIVFV